MDTNIKPEPQKDKDFRTELAGIINYHSLENGSDTPDFILAQYLQESLRVFDRAVEMREQWYGREIESGKPKQIIGAPLDSEGGE